MTTSDLDRTGPVSPLVRLRALHGEQRLAAEYPVVPGLLAELAQQDDGFAQLSRAGRLLAKLVPEDIAERHPGVVPATVAVTGHGTVDGLTAPLTAELARHGIPLRVRVGDHDLWLRDLQDTTSDLYAPGTELALCLLDAQIVFDELPLPWGTEDVARSVAGRLELLDQLASRYDEHGTGTLVLNTLPLLPQHTQQLVDHRSRTELSIIWREFNIGLLRLAAAHPRLHVVDLEPLIAESGPVRDPRLAAYAKVYLGEEVLARYARQTGHLLRTLRGRAKKVLVLDLDNTLWDGILGDDGPDGIAAATTYRGEVFGLLQRVAKQIGGQGVLLAVCSKNDREPVLAVLRDHPDMTLREADFVRIAANWEPKDGNIRDIAEQLNLGTDSFVFADDSPFERGLVASSLPEIAVIGLDEEPALHIDRLLADGWFDVRELTTEDRGRAVQYRQEAERQDLRRTTGSMEEYLRDLGVSVEVAPVRDHEVARVSQITLRTNQFNLTTHAAPGTRRTRTARLHGPLGAGRTLPRPLRRQRGRRRPLRVPGGRRPAHRQHAAQLPGLRPRYRAGHHRRAAGARRGLGRRRGTRELPAHRQEPQDARLLPVARLRAGHRNGGRHGRVQTPAHPAARGARTCDPRRDHPQWHRMTCSVPPGAGNAQASP